MEISSYLNTNKKALDLFFSTHYTEYENKSTEYKSNICKQKVNNCILKKALKIKIMFLLLNFHRIKCFLTFPQKCICICLQSPYRFVCTAGPNILNVLCSQVKTENTGRFGTEGYLQTLIFLRGSI